MLKFLIFDYLTIIRNKLNGRGTEKNLNKCNCQAGRDCTTTTLS